MIIVQKDPLPTNVTYVSSTGGIYNPLTNTVTFIIPILAAGFITSFVISVRATAPGVAANIFKFSSNQNNCLNSNVVTPVVFQPIDTQPTISKSVSVAQTTVATNFTYTLIVDNSTAGSITQTGVLLRDLLPPNVSFVSASTGGVYNPATGVVGFTLPPISPDTISINTITPGIAANSFIYSSLSTALPLISNTVITTIAATIPTPPIIIKSSSIRKTTVGKHFRYRLTVDNTSPGAVILTKVVLIDRLLPKVIFINAPGGTFDPLTNTVTFLIPSIAAGTSVTQEIIVKAVEAGKTQNHYCFSSSKFSIPLVSNSTTVLIKDTTNECDHKKNYEVISE